MDEIVVGWSVCDDERFGIFRVDRDKARVESVGWRDIAAHLYDVLWRQSDFASAQTELFAWRSSLLSCKL